MARSRTLFRLLAGSIAAFAVCLAPVIASAASILIVGNANGSLATGTALTSFNSGTNTFTFTLTNTSPFDARITGVGFDLTAGDFTANGSPGLNGFSGGNVGTFIFSDAALGTVPQFSNAVLDFGWITGNSGNFSGGSPNDGIAPGNNLAFTVSGAGFAGRTDATIANGMFVRFQRVGAEGGELSDVGTPSNPPENPPALIPEPASLTLLGSGLVAAAALRRRNRHKKQS